MSKVTGSMVSDTCSCLGSGVTCDSHIFSIVYVYILMYIKLFI